MLLILLLILILLILKVSIVSFLPADTFKVCDINSGKCLKALKGLKNAVWCIDLF